MSFSTLIIVLVILSAVLVPLVLSFLFFPHTKEKKIAKTKKTEPKQENKKEEPQVIKKRGSTPSFEEIKEIFSSTSSSKGELKLAIEDLIRYHGKIHTKLGDLAHPDFKRYLELIMQMCANPNADKEVIVALDNKLRIKNPKYGLEIDEAVDKGLALRGFKN